MGIRKQKVIDLDNWTVERDRQIVARFSSKPRAERPLTPNHLRYQAAIEAATVTLACGPAGTGKTTLACQVAVKLLKAGQVDHIVLTRPLVTCGEELGILPGTESEKMAPYLAPVLKGLTRYLAVGELDRLVKAGTVKACALATMRGETFERTIVIVDEAENATYGQLHMLLTRLGEGSRFVVNGDISQADVRPGATNAFAQVILKLQGNPEIRLVKMTRADCLRPPLVQWIDERLAGT